MEEVHKMKYYLTSLTYSSVQRNSLLPYGLRTVLNCLKMVNWRQKKDVHLVVSSSNFWKPFYQVSRQFGNLFAWKYITCNSVWLCRNIFEILKLISIYWRYVLCVFPKKTLQKYKKSRGRLKLTYKIALHERPAWLHWPGLNEITFSYDRREYVSG